MTTWHPFNANDYVRFKLTPHGRRCHLWEHMQFWASVDRPDQPYTPLAVDIDGYSKMQLWKFMNCFGQFMVMGAESSPIEMNMFFEVMPCHADPQPSMSSETPSEETPSKT